MANIFILKGDDTPCAINLDKVELIECVGCYITFQFTEHDCKVRFETAEHAKTVFEKVIAYWDRESHILPFETDRNLR